MGTKAEPSLFDAYDKAEPNEPIFVLLGRDPQAPDIVLDWAFRRERSIRRGDHPMSDMAKVQEARALAGEMRTVARSRRASAATATTLRRRRAPTIPTRARRMPTVATDQRDYSLLEIVAQHELATAEMLSRVRRHLPEGEQQRQAALARTEFETAFLRLSRAVVGARSPWTER